MLIYLSFLQSKVKHPIPAYSFWEYYIKNGIEEGDNLWVEGDVDWAEGLLYTFDKEKLAKWKTEVWEKTLVDIEAKHKKNQITFFLSYLYPHQVEEQAIKSIQNMGIPCINFFCDNVREFTRIPKEFAVFNLNWVPEYKAINMYKKAGYNFINLPMPMWVAPIYRNISTIETSDLSFIGSIDVQRWILFEEVIKNNPNIKIYGAGWNDETGFSHASPTKKSILKKIINQVDFVNKQGIDGFIRKLSQRNISIKISPNLQSCLKGKLNFEDYIKVTKESSITLGVNRFPSYRHQINSPNSYSRLRDIEAPMLGACYLTEYTDGLENMYELNNEIAIYHSTEELLYNLKELSLNIEKRKKMRINGQRKALNENSIPRSLKMIQEKI